MVEAVHASDCASYREVAREEDVGPAERDEHEAARCPQRIPDTSPHAGPRASRPEQEAPTCGAFAEPSDGLEPSTRSLHRLYRTAGEQLPVPPDTTSTDPAVTSSGDVPE